MKRFFVLSAFAAASSLVAFADSWSGTVVDVMCKGKDLAGHTAKCAVSCSKGGYGLVAKLSELFANEFIRDGIRFLVALSQKAAHQFPQILPVLIQLFELMPEGIPALNESARLQVLLRPDEKHQGCH